ncbi:MAG: SGNH/GDSL hydrolase family protein [Algibacter sp.]|uniref:SGNH/GDSL hydrolase family protein n=1 Tax=Algibacter sp. TaxID=1872428 RepID=UPI00329A0FCC
MNLYNKIIVAVAVVLNVAIGYSQANTYAKPDWGGYTSEDGFLFAHVVNWPEDGKLVIDRTIKPREARLMPELSKKLKIKLIEDKLTILLPEKAASSEVSIVRIQLTPNDDWANLNKYKKANMELKSSGNKGKIVVFMGNSITERWVDFHEEFFTENNYVGRGISGQTTSQMLLRFKQDVVKLNPEAVVIHAGTNDIAGNTGPISVPEIAENIFSMAELAKANNIKVVLAAVLPASSYSWSPSIVPIDKISELNALLKAYAKRNKMVYLDYYTPMVNAEKGLKKEYGRDTVHPSIDGYLVMEPLVKQAIKKALKRK